MDTARINIIPVEQLICQVDECLSTNVVDHEHNIINGYGREEFQLEFKATGDLQVVAPSLIKD